jgi:hypothetical protein
MVSKLEEETVPVRLLVVQNKKEEADINKCKIRIKIRRRKGL